MTDEAAPAKGAPLRLEMADSGKADEAFEGVCVAD